MCPCRNTKDPLHKKKIIDIQFCHTYKLKVLSFSGKSDSNNHIITFNIAIGRAHFTTKKKETGYCHLFVESLIGPALTWFSRLTENSSWFSWSIYWVAQTLFNVYPTVSFSPWFMENVTRREGREHSFMERFKGLVSKVYFPDATSVEALRNALWIHLPF